MRNGKSKSSAAHIQPPQMVTMAKMTYDEETDVLYVSFGQSEHVTGVELADNILLRLDTGRVTGDQPRAIGLTFVNFSRMMAYHQDRPLAISLDQLRDLLIACGRQLLT